MSKSQSLTQAEINDLIIKMKEEQLEDEAKRKLMAKNEAFDRFFTKERVGATSLPDIDIDPPYDIVIIDYPQMLNPNPRPLAQKLSISLLNLWMNLLKNIK